MFWVCYPPPYLNRTGDRLWRSYKQTTIGDFEQSIRYKTNRAQAPSPKIKQIKIKQIKIKQIKSPQLRDELFFIQAKPKILFAPGPTQKQGILGCFWLAFDNSKTRLQKRRFKIKFSNKRKTSIKSELFFDTSSAKNSFCTWTHTKSGTPRLAFG